MSDIQAIIEEAYEHRAEITPRCVDTVVKDAVLETIEMLDRGEIRAAEKKEGVWVVNDWIKKAVMLKFRIQDNLFIKGGFTNYYDKFSSKFSSYDSREFRESGVRVVPPSTARKGAYIASSTLLLSSYVNVGAYIDSGCFIDIWAAVGSCAQLGKNVHLSSNVSIGGVLEPVQASPTIIEDNCFLGAGCSVVEGVVIGEGSVIGTGVHIGQSTKIYNRDSGEILYGHIPPGSVVVSGSLPAKDGSHSVYCAVIVKQVDEQTRGKVSINELLRDI
ncbi:MAG: 2,3,4,5-tetrahydropyridine-2,6-dicarboxylate N-succinyltransferase [Sedimenticola sp.]